MGAIKRMMENDGYFEMSPKEQEQYTKAFEEGKIKQWRKEHEKDIQSK
jgi:hypothetical protein